MSIQFEYLYRDASNNKRWGNVVFAGSFDRLLDERLRRSLHDGEWFIATQVRLPELFFAEYPLDQDDHCWHEFHSLTACDAMPSDTHKRTIRQLIVEFERAKAEGWREYDRARSFREFGVG